jgi:hypothetical protein
MSRLPATSTTFDVSSRESFFENMAKPRKFRSEATRSPETRRPKDRRGLSHNAAQAARGATRQAVRHGYRTGLRSTPINPASRARPKGVESMGNQYCDTQNDQNACYVR